MTIPLTGNGGLMTRLGLLGGCMDFVNATRGGTATAEVTTGMPAKVAGIETQYNDSPANQSLIDGIYGNLNQYIASPSAWLTYLQGVAQQTVLTMVNQDVTQPDSLLSTALKTLISQMLTAGASVKASVVAAGSQTAVGSPTGNPIFVFSVKDPTGRTCEYTFAETLTLLCTSDSQGSSTAGQEQFSVRGYPGQQSPLSQLWPAGSGVQSFINLVDATLNNSGGNLLQNSDFPTFTTTNQADNWTYLVGTAGTNFFNGTTSNAYTTGGGSLQITGASSALAAFTQQFNTTPTTTVGAGGTLGKLAPLSQYAVNGWVKASSALSAGVLEVALTDGSNTVLQDAQGNNALFTKTISSLSTSWVNFQGALRTPAIMPATARLRIRTSTAIDNGLSIYLGRIGMRQMLQLYGSGPTGGPSIVGFSGNTKTYIPDSWTFGITNTAGAFQRLFQRWFVQQAPGLLLPSAGSPTINDNLIA